MATASSNDMLHQVGEIGYDIDIPVHCLDRDCEKDASSLRGSKSDGNIAILVGRNVMTRIRVTKCTSGKGRSLSRGLMV